MTLRLILMRHAKSDWGLDDMADHDRTLNPRGRAACEAIGSWLAQQGLVPDQVICSDAVRTVETWARIAPYLPQAPAPDLREALYLANADTLFQTLQGATGSTVAMVAHNPGIGDLASRIIAKRPDHEGIGRYPTLATLVVEFPVADWAQIALGTGHAAHFVVPRDLTD